MLLLPLVHPPMHLPSNLLLRPLARLLMLSQARFPSTLCATGHTRTSTHSTLCVPAEARTATRTMTVVDTLCPSRRMMHQVLPMQASTIVRLECVTNRWTWAHSSAPCYRTIAARGQHHGAMHALGLPLSLQHTGGDDLRQRRASIRQTGRTTAPPHRQLHSG